MISIDNIPTAYRAYQSITICSNTINDGAHIFSVGKILPLLIGVGPIIGVEPIPRIWLQAVASPLSKEFVVIVAESKSTHEAVNVVTRQGKVVVSFRGHTVLAVEAKNSQTAVVSELDFRPLGLNVFGTSASLSLGDMQLSNNIFSGVSIAFGLGV